MKTYLLPIIIAAALFAGGFLLGSRSVETETITAPQGVRTDTVRDTIPLKPLQATVVERLRVDTDTFVVKGDTIRVPIPIEQKTFADKQYKAWVSGYRSKLDSIEVYSTTVTTTVQLPPVVKKQQPKISIGVQAGYGVSKEGLSPYIGLGVSYNFISF